MQTSKNMKLTTSVLLITLLLLPTQVSAQQRRGGARRSRPSGETVTPVSREDLERMNSAWACLYRAVKMGRLKSFGRDYEVQISLADEAVSQIEGATDTKQYKLLKSSLSYMRDAGTMGGYKYEGDELLRIQEKYNLGSTPKYEWANVILNLADNSLDELFRMLEKTPVAPSPARGISPEPQPRAGGTPAAKAPVARCSLTAANAPELRGFRLGMSLEQVHARLPGLRTEYYDVGPGSVYYNEKITDEFGFLVLKLDPVDFIRMAQDNIAVSDYDRRKYLSQDSISRTYYSQRPVAETMINTRRYPGFEGARQVALSFVDERIVTIRVNYDGSTQWGSLDEFVNKIAESLNLTGEWLAGRASYDERVETLDCGEVRVRVGFGGILESNAPFVELTDIKAAEIPAVRKAEKDGKQRREAEDRRKVFKP